MHDMDEPTDVFGTLTQWQTAGLLTPLDLAFARFLHEAGKESNPLVLVVAALLSHRLGEGHPALDLHALLKDPDQYLPARKTDSTQLQQPITLANWLQGAGATPEALRTALMQSTCVTSEDGSTPMVLMQNRLYLRRYWQFEQTIAARIKARLQMQMPLPDDLRQKLDPLFFALRSDAERRYEEIHWQTIAAATAARQAFTVISGGPGTGKTTTVVRLLGLLQSLALSAPQTQPLIIKLAAPTGKAAARLTESIGSAITELDEAVQPYIPSVVTTLHRLLGARPDTRAFRHHAGNQLVLDVLVVDEASMIDLEMMSSLLEALPDHARLILLGDKDQLASVEAGAVLGSLCADAIAADAPASVANCSQQQACWLAAATNYQINARSSGGPLADHVVVLRKSQRFGHESGIGQLARAVNRGEVSEVNQVWRADFRDIGKLGQDTGQFAQLILEGNAGQFASTADCHGYRHYLQWVNTGASAPDAEDAWAHKVLHAFGEFRLLAAVRSGEWGVSGLNELVANILHANGLIPATQGWYAGRPILVTRNDYHLGVMNGDIGITLPKRDSDGNIRLRVAFPQADGSIRWLLPSRLNDAETVYAMTVHKSQGSEFVHTALVMPARDNPVLTRELVYTGITRARRWLSLVEASPGLILQVIPRRTVRTGGLVEVMGR